MTSEQIQALKEEIWRRAREKAEKILEDAEREAQRIVQDARRRAEEVLRSRVEPEKLLVRRRIIGRAVGEGRRLVIAAKNELVEKAFEKALEKLKRDAQAKSEDYRRFLLKAFEKAVSFYSNTDGDLIIYANESDINLLREAIGKLPENRSSRIRLERADILGGLIASDPDGRRVYYNTIEGRIEALRPVLREKVASILFGGGGSR